MIHDRNIAWHRQVITRWSKDFHSQAVGVLSGGPPVDTLTATDAATSTVVQEEISTTGIIGAKMNTNGDTVRDLFYMPDTINFAAPLQFRVIYTTGSSTSSDSVLWKVFYKDIAAGSAIAAGDTALSTTIANDNVPATAFSPAFTTWGAVNLSGIGRSATPHLLSLVIEMDTKTAITEDIYCLGYQVSYVPMLCVAPHDPHYEQASWPGLLEDA